MMTALTLVLILGVACAVTMTMVLLVIVWRRVRRPQDCDTVPAVTGFSEHTLTNIRR